MIIDKVKEYRTTEDQKAIDEIRLAQNDIWVNTFKNGKSLPPKEYYEKLQALNREESEIYKRIEERYIEDRKPKGLFEDVREIVNAFELEDFITVTERESLYVARLREEGATEEDLADLKKRTEENYDNCYWYFLARIKPQLNGLAGKPEEEKAISMVANKVGLWYEKPEEAFFLMAHTTETDMLAFIDGKHREENPLAERPFSYTKGGLRVALDKSLADLQATWNPNTDKLFRKALGVFTNNNDFVDNKGNPNRKVIISIEEYARDLGYDVDIHETQTDEEAKKEKLRVKNALANARREIRKQASTLRGSYISWEADPEDKSSNSLEINLFEMGGVGTKEIQLVYSPSLASHLMETPLYVEYPKALFRIPATKPTAYKLGSKLYQHFHIKRNLGRGTYNRLGVETLRSILELPSYEEVQKTDRGHWVDRIKDRIDGAFADLEDYGVISFWEYQHSKGVPLTDEEAQSIIENGYRYYESLYYGFAFVEDEAHAKRIEQLKEKAEKEEAEKQKRKKSNQERSKKTTKGKGGTKRNKK